MDSRSASISLSSHSAYCERSVESLVSLNLPIGPICVLLKDEIKGSQQSSEKPVTLSK